MLEINQSKLDEGVRGTILRSTFPQWKAKQHMLDNTLSLQSLLLTQVLSNTFSSLRFVIWSNCWLWQGKCTCWQKPAIYHAVWLKIILFKVFLALARGSCLVNLVSCAEHTDALSQVLKAPLPTDWETDFKDPLGLTGLQGDQEVQQLIRLAQESHTSTGS